MATSDTETTDGRRARRDRNRTAVIDATFAMLTHGEIPTSEDIAERAGVSVSSVFRYFDGLDDLHQQTIEEHFARFGSLFEIPDLGLGGRPARLRAFVDARVRLHATVAPVARLARERQRTSTPIREQLRATRVTLADQIGRHFAVELSDLEPSRAAEVVANVDCLTSFESWDLLSTTHGCSDRSIRQAWASGVDSLLR